MNCEHKFIPTRAGKKICIECGREKKPFEHKGKLIIIGITIISIIIGILLIIPSISEPQTRTISGTILVPKTTDENNVTYFNKLDITKLERLIHEKVNEQRIQNNLSPLTVDPNLTHIAKLHSLDMATKNYISHYNQENQSPTDRAERLGYYCEKELTSGIAENIAVREYNNFIIDYDYLSDAIVLQWMQSEDHRSNIIESDIDREGIGIALSENTIYTTQDLC